MQYTKRTPPHSTNHEERLTTKEKSRSDDGDAPTIEEQGKSNHRTSHGDDSATYYGMGFLVRVACGETEPPL